MVLLCSCDRQAEVIKIAPYELFHDNGAKVWLLKSQMVNGVEKIPTDRKERWTIVFYKDHTFVINKLKSFGNWSYQQGNFSFNKNADTLIYKWVSGDEFKHQLIDFNNTSFKSLLVHQSDSIEFTYTCMDKRAYRSNYEDETQEEISIYY
ncbi:hypothetical protein [Putridiphycobacter roseus]|uniref:hypothetical protein n=1 Tax=Putridiphycobacter roseus TaxID=2219161 RepID=UPI001314C65C|nr:hypothetical protein [Putridiphycobacter roseus]